MLRAIVIGCRCMDLLGKRAARRPLLARGDDGRQAGESDEEEIEMHGGVWCGLVKWAVRGVGWGEEGGGGGALVSISSLRKGRVLAP